MNLLGFIKLVLKLNVILTASPSMRGSTPLDVAAASVMDNNELALALREPDLEKVGSFFIKHFISIVERSNPFLEQAESKMIWEFLVLFREDWESGWSFFLLVI